MQQTIVKSYSGGILMNKISTVQKFQEYLNHPVFLLFKHSITCPISAAAFEEYSKFSNSHPDVTTAYLAVQEARDLSQYVKDFSHVRHESPQAIIFKNKEAVWSASHGRITSRSLEEAIKEYQ